MMVYFYTAISESILWASISIWYTEATAKDKGRLQRIPPWLVRLQDPQASKKDCSRPLLPWTQTYSRPFPLTWGCGSSGPRSCATRIVSSQLQSGSSTKSGTPTDWFSHPQHNLKHPCISFLIKIHLPLLLFLKCYYLVVVYHIHL